MPPDASENPAPVDNSPPGLRPRKSQWGLLIAIVIGGTIAFGLVQLIPDDWRINVGGSKPDRQKPSAEGQSTARREKETPKVKADNAARNGETSSAARTPERKPSLTKTKEDSEAAELLKEAKALLAAGKEDEAVSRLTRILNEFMNTAAADEASKLLSGD